ncbi:hypothetical protein ACFW6E_37455 [Streptomyces olivaceoviridis]|uniref:hypothetical protein n=1 Tax=Streptomyces olivaceoviridis TaxID=1921 RepID=UPI0036BF2CCF
MEHRDIPRLGRTPTVLSRRPAEPERARHELTRLTGLAGDASRPGTFPSAEGIRCRPRRARSVGRIPAYASRPWTRTGRPGAHARRHLVPAAA